MTTDLTRAADVLRASGRALGENERAEQWQHVLNGEDGHVVTAGSPWVANCGDGVSARNAAAHIALCASYHVTEAVADLLDAIQDYWDTKGGVVDGLRVLHHADRAAVAILREEQT